MNQKRNACAGKKIEFSGECGEVMSLLNCTFDDGLHAGHFIVMELDGTVVSSDGFVSVLLTPIQAMNLAKYLTEFAK